MQALVGDVVEASSPNPRGRVSRVAERVDGKRLDSVAAHGKNLVLRFAGGIVVRSHLGLSGRWVVRPLGVEAVGSPWLVLRGERAEALLWNGPVLELHLRALVGLGPDILERPPRLDAMVARIREADGGRFLGETLLDQRLVAGIGNKWLAEALWAAELSPWRRTGDVSDDELAPRAHGRRGAHGGVGRPEPRGPQRGLPARRSAVPALRRNDQLVRAGRREPDDVLVQRLPGRRRAAGA